MQGEDIIDQTQMASIMCLHFSIQEEDIIKRTKCQVSVVYIFNQPVDHCVRYVYTS